MSDYKYIILCPMDKEFNSICDTFKKYGCQEISSEDYSYRAKAFHFYKDLDLLIVKLGLGRTASCYNFGMILHDHPKSSFILAGVCGAISPNLRLGDVVMPKNIIVGDFKVETPNFFGIEAEDCNPLKEIFEEGPIYHNDYLLYYDYGRFDAIEADFISIDRFADEDMKQKLMELGNCKSKIVDMETASIYWLYKANRKTGTDFYPIRVVADVANSSISAIDDYNNGLEIALNKMSMTVFQFISQIVLNGEISNLSWVKDFPKKGINFLDIQSILSNPDLLRICAINMGLLFKDKFNKVVALDARGFIFGSIISTYFNVPLIMTRKKGKLPAETIKASYTKEYGADILEIEKDYLSQEDKILIVDDIAVTYGSINAVVSMLKKLNINNIYAVTLAHIETITDYQCTVINNSIYNNLRYFCKVL